MMEQNNEEPGTKYSVVAMETTQKLQRICSNIVGYCRTVMNSAGKLEVQTTYTWIFLVSRVLSSLIVFTHSIETHGLQSCGIIYCAF